MNLKTLKSCIDQAYKNTDDGNVDVEVWYTDKKGEEHLFEITEIGQFGFIPDVTITIESYE